MVGNFRHQFIESLQPTFSGVLTNFESFLPILSKYNLVSTFLHRGFMICSSYRTLYFEIQKLKQIFRINAYLKNLVDLCIKMYLHKAFIKRSNTCVVPKKELVCVLPFLGRKSLEIKKRLQSTIERILPYCKLKFVFR